MPKTLSLSLSSCIAALLISGCSQTATQPVADTTEGAPVALQNQSYFGVLPCASCPGIDTHLDLLADGSYFLTETYQDRPDGNVSQLGRWTLDNGQLLLQGQDRELIYFATDSGGWLQADIQGRPIVSELNYSLEPQGWKPAEVTGSVEGMLSYMADAASFIECSTGKRFPVIMTDEWLSVERTYLASSSAAGSYLNTLADVTFKWITPEEGAPRHHLHFNHLQQTLPATTCGSPVESLEHHEWDLVELQNTQSEQLEALQTRPYVKFSGQQISGHTGCNAMAGQIKLEGERLQLSQVASTRMYCEQAAQIENTFLQILEKASYSSLEGESWSWYDEDMQRLASFTRKTALD
ncbi:META domain-containing protein [Nitrincola sp.]|uniref:META domain-containing protein n=1 Tax=Nitrincola sp. TaxID=1926584 RepID=UPI003A8D2345